MTRFTRLKFELQTRAPFGIRTRYGWACGLAGWLALSGCFPPKPPCPADQTLLVARAHTAVDADGRRKVYAEPGDEPALVAVLGEPPSTTPPLTWRSAGDLHVAELPRSFGAGDQVEAGGCVLFEGTGTPIWSSEVEGEHFASFRDGLVDVPLDEQPVRYVQAAASTLSSLPGGPARALVNAVHLSERQYRFASARCLLHHAASQAVRAGRLDLFVQATVLEGAVVLQSAHPSAARSHLLLGLEQAMAMADTDLQIHAQGLLVSALAVLGEWGEARAALDALIAKAGFGSDALASFAATQATWVDLLELDAGASRPDLELALMRSERTAGQYEEQGDVPNLVNELHHQVALLLELGQVKAAVERLERCEDLDPGELVLPSVAKIVRGRLRVATGQVTEAERAFRDGFAEARAEGGGRANPSSWRARWGLAAAARLNRPAAEAAAAYLDALEEMFEATAGSGPDLARALGGRRRFLDEVADALLAAGETGKAFEVAAMVQWLSLGGGHLLEAIEADAPEAAWPEDPLHCFSLPSAPAPGPGSALRRLQEELNDVVLGGDEAFVLLLERPKASQVFVVDPDGIHVAAHDPADPTAWHEQLSPAVRHVYLASPLSEDKGQALFESGAALLSIGRTVSVVPHFGALHRSPKPAPPSRRVALFGTGANFPTEALERRLAESRGFSILEGEDIGGPAQVGPADIFFFSGHGRLGAGSLWRSHLQVEPHRAVPLSDWMAHISARLVILSACETASGSNLRSGHRFGFADALIVAGVEQVLAARGEVGAIRAHRFIDRFVAEGGLEEPFAAYRATVLGLRAKGDPAWSDFVLFGRRPPPVEAARLPSGAEPSTLTVLP